MLERLLKVSEVNGFKYVDLGNVGYGKAAYRLWISQKVQFSDKLEFPIKGKIVSGKSPRTLILRPGDDWIFIYEQSPGYRGTAQIELVAPSGAVLYKYPIYKSPRGNLGVGEGAVVQTPTFPVILHARRTGRLYGAPSEIWVEIISDRDHGFSAIEYEENPLDLLGLLE